MYNYRNPIQWISYDILMNINDALFRETISLLPAGAMGIWWPGRRRGGDKPHLMAIKEAKNGWYSPVDDFFGPTWGQSMWSFRGFLEDYRQYFDRILMYFTVHWIPSLLMPWWMFLWWPCVAHFGIGEDHQPTRPRITTTRPEISRDSLLQSKDTCRILQHYQARTFDYD